MCWARSASRRCWCFCANPERLEAENAPETTPITQPGTATTAVLALGTSRSPPAIGSMPLTKNDLNHPTARAKMPPTIVAKKVRQPVPGCGVSQTQSWTARSRSSCGSANVSSCSIMVLLRGGCCAPFRRARRPHHVRRAAQLPLLGCAARRSALSPRSRVGAVRTRWGTEALVCRLGVPRDGAGLLAQE